MGLVLVGLSHKTTPVEIRERVAFPEGGLCSAHQQLRRDFQVPESFIISTCNRVELVASLPEETDGPQRLKNFFYRYHSISPPELERFFYSYLHHDAIKHVFRVASSLDSMIVGESQILGQMKRAYAAACEAGSVGAHLNSLLPRAFFVAKRVRSETQIGASAVSVSYAAVELARKIFGNLQGMTILLLGAGKMGELAARNLLNSGVSRILVANRTHEKAAELARQFQGTAVPFEEMGEHLLVSDIILVSTGSDNYVLDKACVQQALRGRRYTPLFIVDISVPRNVDPHVNQLDNVFLYDIDDLQSVIDANVREREQQAAVAEEIIEEEVQNFLRRVSSSPAGPVANALRRRIEQICLQELEKSRDSLSPAEYERLRKVLTRTAGRIAHPLIVRLKFAQNGNQELEAIKRVFEPDPE
ncbi:MAG: glutamyl-tRNA reductase [Acidobacteria bacterium]|nr:glutamyl-tRNA reductase [Acidobacteriota bacterium]